MSEVHNDSIVLFYISIEKKMHNLYASKFLKRIFSCLLSQTNKQIQFINSIILSSACSLDKVQLNSCS